MKNQIVVAFSVGGAIIIAPAIFIVALIRLAYVRGSASTACLGKIRRMAEGRGDSPSPCRCGRIEPHTIYGSGHVATREQAMADFKARWVARI
jgi:hypothetical protein